MNRQQTACTANRLPLVRAAFAGPFVTAMRRNRVDADAYLSRNGLPLGPLNDPATLVPEKPFWHLVNQVAIAERIPDFGAQVARVKPWYDMETLHSVLSSKTYLESMLRAFCQLSRKQSNASAFELIPGESAWLFESTARPLLTHDVQMELYRVVSMIDLVRARAGAEWQPDRINLIMAENHAVADINGLRGSPIRFGQARTGILIPGKLLSKPTSAEVGTDHGAVKADTTAGVSRKSDNLAEAIQAVLELYVTEQKPSIELIADLADLTPRSLQRALRLQGTSYRDLLNEARLAYAEKRLLDSDDSIAEIARRLGYREPGHFTRAFRRSHRLSPREFRRIHKR
jgi:AraC-like DNA-binding protein